MNKGLIGVALLLFLGGCGQVTKEVSLIDSVHIISNEGGTTLEKVATVIQDPSSIEELIRILDTAKVGNIIRDDELLLSPAVIYELYEEDELVQTLMFNGEDTLRIFKGGLCFEVSYEDRTLSDWYEQVR